MCNNDVREAIKTAGLKYWQVADRIGKRDDYFSRMLRKELPPKDKALIFNAIHELTGGTNND